MAKADAAGTAGRALAIDDIVAAALRIGAARGFRALTMRALAEELGVSAMAAYHHVPSKDALLDLVVDSVLGRVEIPPAGSGDWEARLRELQGRTRAALRAWPGLDAVVFGRPPTTHGWRLMDGCLRILLDGGFTPRNAVLGFSVIYSHSMGRALVERRLLDGQVATPQAAQRRDWPALREVDGLWEELHRADVISFAEDVILDGLRAIRTGQQPAG